jgi:DNA-binding response OmpR family regulator
MEKIKILVIGSEIHLAQEVQRILEDEGYEVIIVLILGQIYN